MPRTKGRLPRPPISDSKRVVVALRQLAAFADTSLLVLLKTETLPVFLERLLVLLAKCFRCPRDQLRLDHNPALENREKIFVAGVHVDYRPAGADTDHLEYRPHAAEYAGSHHIKTNVRGDRGQLSDNALQRKLKRMARTRSAHSDSGAKVRIAKRKLPSRRFPKGRGFQKRTKP